MQNKTNFQCEIAEELFHLSGGDTITKDIKDSVAKIIDDYVDKKALHNEHCQPDTYDIRYAVANSNCTIIEQNMVIIRLLSEISEKLDR